MPRDKNNLSLWTKLWRKNRKDKWFNEHGPCQRCGSWNNLEIHHRDPSQKVSNAVWSWSEDRRNVELEKCDVLCRDCHDQIHREMDHLKGEQIGSHKLTESAVVDIRKRYSAGGITLQQLADEYEVDKTQIQRVVKRISWRHV